MKPESENYQAFNVQIKNVFLDTFRSHSHRFHVLFFPLFLYGLRINICYMFSK